MLKELYVALCETAVKACAPQCAKVDPTEMMAVKGADGKVEFIGGLPSKRKHKASDLPTLVAFAERFSGKSAIWYSRSAVVCLIDDGDRRDIVTLPFGLSVPMTRLFELQTSRPHIGQRELIFSMRTTFDGCLGECPTFIDALRNVKSEKVATGATKIERGKSSLGKEIRAEVSGVENVPDYVTLTVPAFEQQIGTGSYPVRCVVEVNETQDPPTFQLFPTPGQLESALVAAEESIVKMLAAMLGKDSKIPVYYGQP